MRSHLKEKNVIITYGLLALSFILIFVLFAVVFSKNFTPGRKDLASKDDVVGLNLTVESLSEKMKDIVRTADRRGTCEVGWHMFDGNCYFFSNSNSNWYKARTMCVHRSADLVVINNENEQQFISGITRDVTYWIGLSDIEDEGNWTWVDGTDYKSSYQFWQPNEPNSYGGDEDCGQMRKEGRWNDRACNDGAPFAICEKKL